MRLLRAWEAAFEAGRVGLGAQDLYPGHHTHRTARGRRNGVSTYTSRKSASSGSRLLNCCCREAEGIRPTKALEVAENPTALRAAILARRPIQHEAALLALMDRLARRC